MIQLFGLLALLFGIAPALAQVPDPTRPPAQMTGTEVGGRLVMTPADTGIQALILRPHGNSSAVINGQFVKLGGMSGGKRVVRITESEVVLKGEGGREVIRLTPAIEKKLQGKAAAQSAGKRRSKGTTEQ